MIKLGQKVKDVVTGFEGIITGRAQYIYGCDQYCVVPKARDGKTAEGQWFDEGRIKIIGRGIFPEEVMADKPGGPQRDAPR
jgi:hypothetical protein